MGANRICYVSSFYGHLLTTQLKIANLYIFPRNSFTFFKQCFDVPWPMCYLQIKTTLHTVTLYSHTCASIWRSLVLPYMVMCLLRPLVMDMKFVLFHFTEPLQPFWSISMYKMDIMSPKYAIFAVFPFMGICPAHRAINSTWLLTL